VFDHPLDNPVWEALRTHHARFAMRRDRAARYAPEVAPFAAVSDAGSQAAGALAELLAPGEMLYGVGPPPAGSPLLTVEDHGLLAQMVWTAPFEAARVAQIIELTDANLADMLALMALVYPAYFRPHTPQMGAISASTTGRVSRRWRASACMPGRGAR
jgi:hypothetical protein